MRRTNIEAFAKAEMDANKAQEISREIRKRETRKIVDRKLRQNAKAAEKRAEQMFKEGRL